jgi:hypothetical protein
MAFSLLPREDEYFIFFTQMTEKIQEAKIMIKAIRGSTI